jgi:hypothetical protein
MFYFNSFPKVITTDYNGNGILLTNIIKRVNIIPALLNNPLLNYSYDLQEGDTPDIVAHKYYGDSYRYWLPLFANNIINPQWQWPMSSGVFDSYIQNKYADAAAAANVASVLEYTQSTVYQYTKTIETIDGATLNTTKTTIVIDESTYNSTNTGITTSTFPGGATVSQTVTTGVISIYDYELEKNESNRSINLINSIFTSQIESQFASLMKL